MNEEMLIVFTTTPSVAEAENLAGKIIESDLAACVQVLPEMKSFYKWKGKLHTDSEHLLIIKTLAPNYSKLEVFIKTHHSYEVPEIVAVSADKVSAEYSGWLAESLKEMDGRS